MKMFPTEDRFIIRKCGSKLSFSPNIEDQNIICYFLFIFTSKIFKKKGR
jgi:hypothetical protein